MVPSRCWNPQPQAELSAVLVSQAPAKSSVGEVEGISLGLWKLRAGVCALVPKGVVPCSSTSVYPCLSSHSLLLLITFVSIAPKEGLKIPGALVLP